MGDEIKHSSAPWRAIPLGYGASEIIWNDTHNGVRVAACVGDADARRIVACVNACSGIPTEQLECGPGHVKLAAVLDAMEARAKLDRETVYQRAEDGTVTVRGGWDEWKRTVDAVERVQEALRALGRYA